MVNCNDKIMRDMKNILIIAGFLIGLIACKNQDNDFPDYKYTTAYFPYQYPVRTLVLGDYIYDNTNDNNHTFLISAAMGGVYTNTKDRTLDIGLTPDLCKRALFAASKDTIRLMPESYYTLSSSDKLVIPAGEFNGSIEVHLKDAFFTDPYAIKNTYVIPLMIKSSNDVDSILQGKKSIVAPDIRIDGNWITTPKNFTMFAVKYINQYHGKYLHRGASSVKDGTGNVIDKAVYRTTYIVDNEVWSLTTTGFKQVSTSGAIRSSVFSGTLNMLLTFDDNGNCTVKENTGSAYTITGTGKFLDDADEWGNKKRDAIHISYQFTNGGKTYSATDTLVIRDRAVVLETYKPVIF